MSSGGTDLIDITYGPGALVVFGTGSDERITSILGTISEKARAAAAELDISTEQGRKDIASLAYKVARSKTALDEMGRDLAADLRERVQKIDAERRRVRDGLDALRDEVRRPLTEWERREETRIKSLEDAIGSMSRLTALAGEPASADVSRRIAVLDEIVAQPREWAEFASRAAKVEDDTRRCLVSALLLAESREAERAELERLRREAEERKVREADEEKIRDLRETAARPATLSGDIDYLTVLARNWPPDSVRPNRAEEFERVRSEVLAALTERRAAVVAAEEAARVEREVRIAREAAERERLVAEAKAAREREEAERRWRQEQERAEQQRIAAERRAAEEERRRIEAEELAACRMVEERERAEREMRAAVEAERRRAAEVAARAEAEWRRREEDEQRRAVVLGEISAAISAALTAEDDPEIAEFIGKFVARMIIEGRVPHVQVEF